MSIKSLIRAAQFYINKIVGDRYVSVHFSDLVLKFDTHWKHELEKFSNLYNSENLDTYTTKWIMIK